jgi:hypothetical protein
MGDRIESNDELEFTPRTKVFPSPTDWTCSSILCSSIRFDNNQRGLRPYIASAPKGRGFSAATGA